MLKIENGKRYVTRGGDIVGPMNVPPKYKGWSKYVVSDCEDYAWLDGGLKVSTAVHHKDDLISEYVEAPATDLTAITTPFGLLDEATQSALKAHGGPYEAYYDSGWLSVDKPFWNALTVYRIAPAYTPDVVPWDAVDDRFEWYARDKGGAPWFYVSEPKRLAEMWDSGVIKFRDARILKITIGNAPWDKSLQRRPGI